VREKKTTQPKLSADAHWLYIVAFQINGANAKLLRKEAYYLHSIDDIMKPFFTLGFGLDAATNVELGIDTEVVNQLKKNGNAERKWLGRDIEFKYSLVPLKHADMMRYKTE
jgi:hypothetical protein